MNVLQLARRFSPNDWGGTETVILETSRELRNLGHKTTIMCTTATDPVRSESIRGVPVRRFPYFYPYIGLDQSAMDRFDHKGGNPFSFRLMQAVGAYERPDLIHLHVFGRLGGIGRRSARKRGIPYVVSVHGGMLDVPAEEARSWTAPAKGALEWGKVLGLWVGSRRVLKDAAAVLCVSRREAELMQDRYPDKRVVHLPNGVDADRFASGSGDRFRDQYSIPAGAVLLLTVARIDSQKNQLFLVRQLPRLLEAQPHVHLALIGSVTSESYYRELLDLIRRLEISEHVTVIPGLPAASEALLDAYKAADIFVLPSIHEPFGIVILEAWAAGCPVVASRVGGVPAFVEDADGVLFRPSDSEDFFRGIQPLLHDPQRRRELGEQGRAKTRRAYSWQSVTRRLVDLYESVISDSTGFRIES